MNKKITKLIMDMDGVLWHGDTPMPGLVDYFHALDTAGIDYILATNNATKRIVQYAEKLAGFGVHVPAEKILTSAESTAVYLAEEYDLDTPIYIVGDSGLYEAITSHGFRILSPADVRNGEFAPVVVVGLSRTITYEGLAMAAHLVERGARFIGTNPDASFPSEIGPLPGSGAIIAVVEASTGVTPFIIGKPAPVMFHEAIDRLGGDPDTIAMVGDRLSTDIAGGRDAGLQTIMVLSGISTREEAEQGDIHPDYIVDDISAIPDLLKNGQS
ncbi:MAG: HAD-IIA family hydrolase [Chloroflexota bacterium]